MKNYNNQQGFTLIELMISITLGLLVIAIGAQIYLTSYKTSAIQQSAGEIQASSIFGIQQIENHVRLANLGNDTIAINDTTLDGGIILSNDNVTDDPNAAEIDEQYLTSTNNTSSRLTIQFTNITGKPMFDCEGTEIPQNTKVIESYYLQDSDIKCDASQGGIDDLGSDAEVVIKDVEVFYTLLGVQNTNRETTFADTADYISISANKPMITSIKMGFLLKGSKPLPTTDDTKQFFRVLDKTIDMSTQGKYVRNVYESTTGLRNARGRFTP